MMDLSFIDDIIDDIGLCDPDFEAQYILPDFEHINFNYDFDSDVMSTLHTQ